MPQEAQDRTANKQEADFQKIQGMPVVVIGWSTLQVQVFFTTTNRRLVPGTGAMYTCLEERTLILTITL